MNRTNEKREEGKYNIYPLDTHGRDQSKEEEIKKIELFVLIVVVVVCLMFLDLGKESRRATGGLLE
jgi:hypothetical protein